MSIADHTRYLTEKNPLPHEKRIRFEDEGHMYFYYSGYYDDWITSKDGAGVAPLVSTTTVLSPVFPYGGDQRAMWMWNRASTRHRMKTDKDYFYYGCNSVADIQMKWKEFAEAGTKMHANFEDLCNVVAWDVDNPPEAGVDTMTMVHSQTKLSKFDEMQYFEMFVDHFGLNDPDSPYEFYRTELLVYNPILHLSGAIDCILYNRENDTYVICDYKRCKGLDFGTVKNQKLCESGQHEEVHPNARAKMLPSAMKILNENGNKHSCQQTMYKRMFEDLTGKTVSEIYLVVVLREKIGTPKAFKLHKIDYTKFDPIIDEIFEWRARDMLSKYPDTLDDDHMDRIIEYLPPDDDEEMFPDE